MTFSVFLFFQHKSIGHFITKIARFVINQIETFFYKNVFMYLYAILSHRYKKSHEIIDTVIYCDCTNEWFPVSGLLFPHLPDSTTSQSV